MKLSQLLGMRLRSLPEGVRPEGLAWLIRAGFVQRLYDGRLAWLPLGQRVLATLADALRAELNGLGVPLQPFNVGPRAASLEPGGTPLLQRTTCLEIGRQHIHSYKNLPAVLCDAGDGRSMMLATLSAGADEASALWEELNAGTFRALQRCGLAPLVVEDGNGLSFLAPDSAGPAPALICPRCGYRAMQATARFHKPRPPEEVPLPLQKVATPGAKTIAELCAFLGIPPERTAKAVLLTGDLAGVGPRLIFALVRGDMEVSLAKIAQATGAHTLRPATEEEIRACGAEPGYASPLGVHDALVIVDDLIPYAPNLVAGANEPGYHLRNVTYSSDFEADVVADIALAQVGSPCPTCGAPLEALTGLPLARAWRQGAVEATYQDPAGQAHPWHLALWEADLETWAIALAQRHHDAQGLRWPVTVAPYAVHLVVLMGKQAVPEIKAEAERLYAQLQQAGVAVLFDDRPESAGVKFTDADLIGLPLRITLSERTLKAGGAEIKHRGQELSYLVDLKALLPQVLKELETLRAAIEAGIVPWIA